MLTTLNQDNLKWILDSDFYFPFETTNSFSSFKVFIQQLVDKFKLIETFLNGHIDQIYQYCYHKDFHHQVLKRNKLSLFKLILLSSDIFIFHQDKIIDFLYDTFNISHLDESNSKGWKPKSYSLISQNIRYSPPNEEDHFYNFSNLKFKTEINLINSLGYSFLHYIYSDSTNKQIFNHSKIHNLNEIFKFIFFINFQDIKSVENYYIKIEHLLLFNIFDSNEIFLEYLNKNLKISEEKIFNKIFMTYLILKILLIQNHYHHHILLYLNQIHL
jgi:hypothetical protein